jgi:hypothetical protein
MSHRFLGVVALASLAAGCTLDERVAMVGPRFQTLAAGTTLPDDATCASLVRRSGFEPRMANKIPNHVVPTTGQVAGLTPWDSAHAYDNHALSLEARITGAFTGTTDEILQWVACKWGFNEDHVRAEAVESSNWTQGLDGDWTTTTSACPPDADTRQGDGGVECAETYGMFQVVWQYHVSAWPMYHVSTPFHVDYVYALRRACFEGWDTWQGASSGTPYVANDEWGCMGAHFSGGWHDAPAESYVAKVKGQLAGRAWTRPDF